MLVRADAFPVVELVKSAEAVDAAAAALWVHLACFDALNEEIAAARPEMDAVWKSVVAERSVLARGALVRKAIERRIEGGEIDDVVKAAAGIALVRGVLAKADNGVAVRDEDPEPTPGHDVSGEARDARGRWTRNADQVTRPQKTSFDALNAMTTRNDPRLQQQAQSVATQLQGTKYDRMRVLGNTLVATGNPHAAAAGGVARVVAEAGPSAEQVLGPHLRRIAYRYRGTEKRPDPQLKREVEQARVMTDLHIHGDDAARARVGQALDERSPGEWGKGAAAVRLHEGDRKHWSPDQVELRATGDVAATHLIRQLPTLDEAFLSQEAGRTPPSLGVIIDRDGDVVTEAQGFNGDHYVPFDLKNLKRMHGGSYVRTRALGGPTGEDIYTGLLGGARQMQVVSRSGVFTVEFDPDLRGGRRYSDKAKQMVDRYNRILDRVEESGAKGGKPIYTQDISGDRKRELWQQAMEASDYDEEEADRRYKRLEARERSSQSFGYTQEELADRADEEISQWIEGQRRAGRGPSRTEIGRQREQVLREVTEQAVEEKNAASVRRLQLDAEGYFRAMQSLKREFPYFIRDVDYEPLRDFEEKRRTRERGEPPSPRGAPAATRTHVGRGNLVPAAQATSYGIRQRVGAPVSGTPEGGGGATNGEGGKGKTAETSAARPLSGILETDRFRDRVGQMSAVLSVLGTPELKPHIGALRDDKGQFPDRAIAAGSEIDPLTYLAWLKDPSNSTTRGESTGIARFITSEASGPELLKIQDGLRTAKETATFGGANSPENIQAFSDLVGAVAAAKNMWAENVEGDPVLHMPPEDDMRPVRNPAIEKIGDDPEGYDEYRKRREIDSAALKTAFGDAQTASEPALGKAIRQQVMELQAVQEWGQELLNPRPGREVHKPDDVPGDISAQEAREVANDPKNHYLYRNLAAAQEAWAWKRAKTVAERLHGVAGRGGAGPKAPPAIETGKRLSTSSRQVVWHQPDDPLSVALAKRLRSRV